MKKSWKELYEDAISARRDDLAKVAALEARCRDLTQANVDVANINIDLIKRNRELESALKETSVDRPCRHYDNPALCKICNPTPLETCEHEWVDARNKVVTSGELCLKCYAIRAGNSTMETPASSMDHGGVGQVGCENAGGTLNIHGEDETCEVCSTKETPAKPFISQEALRLQYGVTPMKTFDVDKPDGTVNVTVDHPRPSPEPVTGTTVNRGVK